MNLDIDFFFGVRNKNITFYLLTTLRVDRAIMDEIGKI